MSISGSESDVAATSVPPPSPPAPRSRLWLAIVVAAVAVVVVVAALAVSGVFNSSSGGSGTVYTPVAYSTVAPLASAAGQGVPGGPWTVVGAEGIGVPNEVANVSVSSIGGGACTYSQVAGGPTNVSIPATPSGTTPGKAVVWVFFAKNASLDSILLIAAGDGRTVPFALVTGCGLVTDFTILNTIVSANVVDSTSVASTFDQDGGTSFLGNYTLGSELFILIGASSFSGGDAVWEVEYSTCVVAAASAPGSWISADYYASTGVEVKAPKLVAGTCN